MAHKNSTSTTRSSQWSVDYNVCNMNQNKLEGEFKLIQLVNVIKETEHIVQE